MREQRYKLVCQEEARENKSIKSDVSENRSHIHRITNASTRSHSIFVGPRMGPFSLKYLFCYTGGRFALITADSYVCAQTAWQNDCLCGGDT